MGILRFLLALSVAWTHAELPHGLSGELCVTVFFVISGFYMTLVLNNNPVYLSPKAFYFQRMLRIFPAYWAILLLSLAFSLFESQHRPVSMLSEYFDRGDMSIGFLLAYCASQVLIVGQDALLFLDMDTTGRIFFQGDISQATNPLNRLNFIGQAWSLALELMFYAIAPFLLRRSVGCLIAVALSSFAIRLALALWLGYVGDPWTTRFFPSELSFFVLGALAYRLVIQRQIGSRILGFLKYLILVSLIVGSLIVNHFGRTNHHNLFTLVPLTVWTLVAAIPLLFLATQRSAFDREIGELSYPLYICHILVFQVGHNLYGRTRTTDIALMIVSIAFAYLLKQFIDKPVDRYRHGMLRKQMAPRTPPNAEASLHR